MTTRTAWKAMLAARGINVWVSEKVARNARGIVIEPVVNRLLEYRDASLRLFIDGNSEASYWAARAMEDRAIELDCAIDEKTETIAGRRVVAGGRKGEEIRKSEMAGSELRPRIVDAIKQYKGAPRNMASTLAKKFGCTSAYVRQIKNETPLR